MDVAGVGGGGGGDGELEVLLRLPERAQAGVEAEGEGPGVVGVEEPEVHPGVGEVAGARRGVVEVVVVVDLEALGEGGREELALEVEVGIELLGERRPAAHDAARDAGDDAAEGQGGERGPAR